MHACSQSQGHLPEELEIDSPPSPSFPSTPEHKLISTYSPGAIKKPGCSSAHSLNRSEADSPQLWVQKVTSSKPDSLSQSDTTESSDEHERVGSAEDQYHFGHPSSYLSHSSDELASQSSEVSTVVTAGNRSQSHSLLASESAKNRCQAYSTVEADSRPVQEAFSSNLVFVHGSSTSSSVFSPTNHLQGYTSIAGSHPYSPNHLSNSFGGTDTIDSTGLFPLHPELESLEFVNSVFTASDSQDSVHFSPRDSDGTFHVNLTQTSQPDTVSAGNTQPDDFADGEYGRTQELPTISEIPNSSPIDTFNLHCSRVTTGSNLTLTDRPNVEYSNSQDFRDRITPQLSYTVGEIREVKNLETTRHEQPLTSTASVLQENNPSSPKGGTSPVASSLHAGRSSVIVVSYIPCAESPTRERIPYHPREKTLHEHHSSPHPPAPSSQLHQLQQPRKYSASKPRKESSPPRKPCQSLQARQNSHSDTESETEMSSRISKDHHNSGKQQMFAVPTGGLNQLPSKEVAITTFVSEPSPTSNGKVPQISEGKEIPLILFPHEKKLGFELQEDRGESDAPVISVVDAGKL